MRTGIEPDESSLWNASFVGLLCINILSSLAFNLVAPVLSAHVVQMGASLSVAGAVVGAFSLTALILGPFGGVLTDHYRKKYVLVLATAINGLSTLGYVFAPNVPVMLMFRILHGAGFAVSLVANLSWISDYIPQERLGEGIGYYSMSQIIATAFGPNIGIWISDRYGIPRSFFIAAAGLLLAAMAMAVVPERAVPPHSAAGAGFRGLRLRDVVAFEVLPLSLIGGLFSAGNGLVSSFLVLLGRERAISGVGAYFTVNALCLLFTRPLAGKLYDRRGLSVILYPALACGACEAILLGHASALWMIVAAAVIKAFGQGIAQPALQAESLRRLGAQRRGVASSTFYIGANVGQGFGPLLGGIISQACGYATMFYLLAGCLLAGMVAYSRVAKTAARADAG